jgi:hypothetical protein
MVEDDEVTVPVGWDLNSVERPSIGVSREYGFGPRGACKNDANDEGASGFRVG